MRKFDYLILRTISDIDEAYAVSITRYLEQSESRMTSIPQVLSALKVLEKMGFIRSTPVLGSEVRNGHRKRIYSLTQWGVRCMEKGQYQDITEERQYFYKTPGFNSV